MISGIAAASGLPQFQMGDVLVARLRDAVPRLAVPRRRDRCTGLLIAFVTVGIVLGVAHQDLVFAASVLLRRGSWWFSPRRRVERLVRTSFVETQRLSDIAERDGLSGLYNRRMFDTLTRRLWQQAQRDADSLQVILVDIDHFKRFNDLYGHQAGDDCIRRVAVDHRARREAAARLLRALRRRRVRARAVCTRRATTRARLPSRYGATSCSRGCRTRLRRGKRDHREHGLRDRGARHEA